MFSNKDNFIHHQIFQIKNKKYLWIHHYFYKKILNFEIMNKKDKFIFFNPKNYFSLTKKKKSSPSLNFLKIEWRIGEG